jgi:hypothetical protein
MDKKKKIAKKKKSNNEGVRGIGTDNQKRYQ